MATLTPVKAAAGRLVRDPVTLKPLPTMGDAADPVTVDLDDPLWYRRQRDGDITAVTKTGKATTTTPASSASVSSNSSSSDTKE